MFDLREVKLKQDVVHVPALDADVHIKELGAAGLVALQAQHKVLDGADLDDVQVADMNFTLVSQSVINDDGVRYLDNAEGREIVRELPWPAVVSIAEAALQLNGMLDQKKTD